MDVRLVGDPVPAVPAGGPALLVGVQRGRVVENPRPVTGSPMVFDLSLDVVVTPDGLDLRGPFVQGRRGDRFLYLCWGHGGRDGSDLDLFRRAKLMLGVLDPADLVDARDDDVLVGRLSLVDARGGPVCAAVRPPAIRWTLEAG